MKRLIIVMVAVTAAAVVPLGMAGSDAETPGPTLLNAWAVGPTDCLLGCVDYGVSIECIPSVDEHWASEVGDTHEYGGGWHYTCYRGTCSQKHPACEPNLIAVNEVQKLISDGIATREKLSELADRHPGILQVASNALIIWGCDGQMSGRIPLDLATRA